MIKDELHLHLHGCLSADDIWHLAQDSWETRKPALEWYAKEYQKAWGRLPKWETYWTDDFGWEELRRDYEFKNFADFTCFQASFNLVIALFPLSPDDDSLPRFILEKYSKSGVRYAEFRTPIGIRFADDAETISRFFTMLATLALDIEQRTELTPRFAISLPREHGPLEFQYACLKEWLRTHPELSSAIVGIDFCGFEEGSAPETKREFFRKVREDNIRHPETALAILYHVGESFEKIGIERSINWVKEAHDLGAHRLGHCTSLGIDPSELLARGYEEGRVEAIRNLQDSTMQYLKNEGVIIESCPRSNTLIAKIRTFKNHPLVRFLKNGLKVVLSSDDPGIFNTSLYGEVEFARSSLGVSDDDLHNMANLAREARSENISGRLQKMHIIQDSKKNVMIKESIIF